MRRMLGSIAAALAVAAIVAACTDVSSPRPSPLAPGGASFASAGKVTICHAAGLAGTTHYIEITISVNGLNGHFDNNGTPRAGHEQDFIVSGPGLCPTAQLQICKVLGRGTDKGTSFDFTTSDNRSFSLLLGQCTEVLNVVPGTITITEAGFTPVTSPQGGSYFATGISTSPGGALVSSTGVSNTRPAVKTDAVAVVTTTTGTLTTVTFENSN
jgi:hypothetical protein